MCMGCTTSAPVQEIVVDSEKTHPWAALLPRRIDPSKDRREWLGVTMTMQDTQPFNLGFGNDHVSPGHYDRLEAVAAWRLEPPTGDGLQNSPWSACQKWREQVREELRVIKQRRCQGWWRSAADDDWFRTREMRGFPISNEKPSLLLEGEDQLPHLNEAMLLHGTKRDNLPGILAEGFRFDPDFVGSSSGSAFGDGIYLCDRPGKADQYGVLDAAYDESLPLHRQLYTGADDHPGFVFYVLVCRVTLGYPVLTRESKQVATTMEQVLPPWSRCRRLLRSHRLCLRCLLGRCFCGPLERRVGSFDRLDPTLTVSHCISPPSGRTGAARGGREDFPGHCEHTAGALEAVHAAADTQIEEPQPAIPGHVSMRRLKPAGEPCVPLLAPCSLLATCQPCSDESDV